jgi:hypothetical protein
MDVEFPGIAKLAEGFHRAGVAPEWQRMFMESVISKSGYLVPGYCMLGEILQDMLKSGWSGTRVSTPMAILVEAKAPDLALDAYESIYSILKRFVDHDGIADFLKYIVDRAGVDEDPEELLEKLAQPLMQAPKQTYLAFVQSFLEVRRDSGVPLLELLQEGIRQEGWYKIQA